MLFLNKKAAVRLKGTRIYLDTKLLKNCLPFEKMATILLPHKENELQVFQDTRPVIRYVITPKSENPDLAGQYIHLCIRVQENWALMIDGIINREPVFKKVAGNDWEGIRFQPVFLAPNEATNAQLVGQGLFKRGLHFSGMVTPSNVRLSCVCDVCKKGFNIQSFHAGFSEAQYFYSDDSTETLFVPYGKIAGMSGQLQDNPSNDVLREVEAKLPASKSGAFRFYNPFRCPHCAAAYIDFQKNPGLRQEEYYGNVYTNGKVAAF